MEFYRKNENTNKWVKFKTCSPDFDNIEDLIKWDKTHKEKVKHKKE